MPRYTLTNQERETHISWNAADKVATIDTADPAVIRKLDKLTQAHPDAYRCTRVDGLYQAKKYTVNARYIRFGKPASEAVREANRKRSQATQFKHK